MHVLQPAVLALMVDPSSLKVIIMPCAIGELGSTAAITSFLVYFNLLLRIEKDIS
jgi:hypothetical protein